MNNLSKLNLLYLLSIFCYTSFSYAQNTCETTLSDALALPTTICDGEFADFLVTVENSAIDGELNWYNANTNELISNPQKVHLYANESSCSIVIHEFYAVYSVFGCEDVFSEMVSVSVYPPIEGSIENSNCSVSLMSDCVGYATNWTDSDGNTGDGNTYIASSSGSGMVTFMMFDPNNSTQISCNSAIFVESYACESCDAYAGSLSSSDDTECVVGVLNVQTTGLVNENYDYHYAVVDANSNLILLLPTANVDFTNIPAGNYCLYGVSSLNSESINTDVINLDSLFDANACFDVSDCLNVTKVETPTYVISTEPTCNGDGTFDIGFTITNQNGTYQVSPNSLNETIIALANIEVIMTFSSGSHAVSIRDINAPECLAPSVIIFSQSCGDECPGSDEQLQANSLHICSGEMLNLNLHFVDTLENINWFAFEGGIPNATTTGSLVSDPENLSFATSNCEIVEHNFTANYPIEIDGCFYTKVLYAKVFVYPKITINGIVNDNCMIELSQDCDNFTAIWEDSFGNNGTGFSYQIDNSNAAGNVNFSIHSGFIDGSGCDLETITQTFDCSANSAVECANFESVTASKNEMCDGEVLSLNAIVNNDDGGNLIWFRADNNAFISNPNAFVLQENICESTIYSFYATYEPSTIDCSAIVSETIEIIAHPVFNPTIETIDCQVILISNCESFDISWTDSYFNSGEGNVYNAIETDGFLTFQAHLNASDTANDCVSSWTYNAAFTCESPVEPENPNVDCPEISQPETIETELCSGNVFSLHWYNQTATWFDEAGNEVENAGGFILALPFGSCEMQYFDYYYVVATISQPAECGEEIMLIQHLRIAVFPQISATILQENDCQVSITQGCENFTAVWQDSNGNVGVGFDYLATENTSGTVNFQISSTSTNCNVFAETVAFNCGEPENPNTECPEIEQPETIETEICSGEVFSLHWYNQTEIWFNEAGNEVENAGGFIVELPAGNCEAEYFEYYYVVETINQPAECGENVTLIQRVRLAVFPSISATVVEQTACSIVLSQDCDNFFAIWQDGNGNVGLGFEYEATANTSGTVSFQITDLMTGCLPLNMPFAYTCNEETTELPSEICDFPVLSTCVEPNETADICIFCEDEQEIIVSNVTSLNNAASFDIQQSCFSLTPFAAFNNTIDTVYIEYCLAENVTVCSSTNLILTIGCTPNMPPIAMDDFYLTMSDIIVLDLTANDFDPDGDAIQVSGFTPPANGTLTMSDGVITYIPDLGFVGTEEITYQLCDGYTNCTTATISIEVMASDCETTTFTCTEPMTPTLICPEFCGLPANADVYIADAIMTYSCSLQLPHDLPTCIRYTALPLFVGTETIAIIGCDANTGICDTSYVVVQVTACDDFEEENIETTIEEEDNNGNDGEILDDFVDTNSNDVENEVVAINDNGTGKAVEHAETSNFEILEMYPIPTQNELNIALKTQKSTHTLRLYDLNTRLIWQEKRTTTKGINSIQISLETLSRGIYMLAIENETEQIIQKIVKQ